MANILETIDKTETVLILAAIGVGVYLLYQAGGAFADFIDKLTGASAENTYANAATQTVSHPVDTAGTILGGWWSDLTTSTPSSSGSLQPLSELSSVGYTKIGASGQHWSCSGPQGASNDMCVPVSVDASGNMTTTGAATPATQAN